MNLTIKINLDNVAFQGGRWLEVERILQSLIIRLQASSAEPPLEFKLFDVNGNSVGTLKLEE